mmetsp:Transcript_6581/g.19426  ORF Transcript_6581/g.19426 Transcript_6581/m.19426 type:complete len:130 (-) Transcript_6581:43-432(-)|eukprot:CAMPEP_0119259486 /NCGR_PEP_ID=MMETSP1329-20130426/287_1 /TAXON_ID=114041 /ORGANISM="Genus nov. species nov., Strain RCC1024" /LENGTH=129 /DNA_ID=CAMNT_0007258871 /DNA_START=252 /DNA_END=641 /DNA_ORIENTATION=-
MSVAAVLIGYGGFLGACGWYGAAAHDYAPKVMHSLYAGAGSGLAMALCGLGSFGSPQKGEAGYKRWMIAVHLGLMGNALFLAVFGLQWFRATRDPAKADRAPLFLVMAAGSAMALAALVKLKPKKKKET